MKVKALKDGFCDSRRKAGEVFTIEPRQLKGWMEKIAEEPKAAKAKPEAKPQPQKAESLI